MWQVEHGRLCFRHPRKLLWWEVPAGFELPHPALLALAEYLLVSGLGERGSEGGGISPRPFGTKVGLAYSGGCDSTAACYLLPDPTPIYTRVANPSKLHRFDNALLALHEVGGVSVLTNSDELAGTFGRKHGFYGTGAFMVTAILFADYYDFGTVADGNVLETLYLYGAGGHGTKYRARDLSGLQRRFEAAGLYYCAPCAGMSEVVTTRIAQENRFAMGCMRGTDGKPCNDCMKCYRKNALQGHAIPPCRESELKLSNDIIPMLPSLLWSVRTGTLSHPVLDRIDKNISWVDKWYEDSIRYVPDHLRPYFMAKLEDYGIEAMGDDSALKAWVSDRQGA
ncbi:DUF6395 domain-containing protein [Luteimonas padinae]|uniref:DUF6395 domain-containing protein n=1 Tax=Luteimonas padinae TaxID=1714359 RepID=A0ABV6SX52_9GAMM|nr:DUF6395 domain-containing protein [Luteimonas padinae]